MSPNSIFLITTLLTVFSASVVGAVLAKKLKLPAVLGYIAAGVIFGNVLPRITDRAFLSLMADSGVTLLLFTLGLEFSFFRLRKTIGLILWAAIAQIVVSVFVFLFFFLLAGFSFVPAMVLAAAASLSSTAVGLKVLAEKGGLDAVVGD